MSSSKKSTFSPSERISQAAQVPAPAHSKSLPYNNNANVNCQSSSSQSSAMFIFPHSRPIKRRRRLSNEETRYLQEAFNQNQRPNSENRAIIANKLGLSNRAIQIWFQNRRAKLKKDSQDTKPGLVFSNVSNSSNALNGEIKPEIFHSAGEENSSYKFVDVVDTSGFNCKFSPLPEEDSIQKHSSDSCQVQWNWEEDLIHLNSTSNSEMLTPTSPTTPILCTAGKLGELHTGIPLITNFSDFNQFIQFSDEENGKNASTSSTPNSNVPLTLESILNMPEFV